MNSGEVFSLCLLLACVYLIVENIPNAVGIPSSGKNYQSVEISHEAEIETGDIAFVRLLTRPRNKRDLSENEYHILEVDIPSKKKNLKLHIMKTDSVTSPNLQTFVRHENGTRELLSENSHNCLYTGTISGEGEQSVALSACDSNTPGFTGMITHGDEHLFIQPKMSTTDENLNTNETKGTMEMVHVVHTGSTVPGAGYSDAVNVPKSDLEAAVALMAKQLKKYKQNSNGNSENEVKNTFTQTMDFNGNFDNNIDNGVHIKSLAYKSSQSSSSGTKTVDLAVFCDAKLYRNYQKKFSKDTVKQMKTFVLTLVHCMCLIYKHKSMTVPVEFKLVLLEVNKNDSPSLGASEDANSYLKSFCRYSGMMNTDNESWDHALMLTGYDIHGDGNPAVAGLAYAGTMCLQYWSCSVSEAKSFGCVYTISHELGHSLGMDHDGSGESKSCNSEKYIMSPTTGAGKTTWSKCSNENIIEFIKTGNNVVGSKSSSTPVCLTKASNKKSIKFISKKLPGEVYDAKAQCVMDKGDKYTPFTQDSKYADICKMLHCGRPETSFTIMVIGTHPALEGTSCASGKKCRGGKCV